jgi:hypothetical protein
VPAEQNKRPVMNPSTPLPVTKPPAVQSPNSRLDTKPNQSAPPAVAVPATPPPHPQVKPKTPEQIKQEEERKKQEKPKNE